MKTLIAFSFINFAIFFGFSVKAHAGNTSCHENLSLVCTTSYQTLDGTTTPGETATQVVKDMQPEPFDPAICAASTVFNPNEGKIVVTFDDNHASLDIFIDPAGKAEKTLVDHAPFAVGADKSVSIPALPSSKYQFLVLTCSLHSTK